MPWCPVCNKVQEIYPDTTGDSVPAYTKSERYNRDGEYIGYEERESFRTTIRTIPRCRGCNTVFELPNVTSREQYFYAKMKPIIASWYKKKPEPEDSRAWDVVAGVGAGLLIGCIVSVTTHKPVLALVVGLPLMIGLGILIWRSGKPDMERKKEYEAKLQAWTRRLEELRSMKCSDTNCQRLMSGQL